jgi:hypothetical protein
MPCARERRHPWLSCSPSPSSEGSSPGSPRASSRSCRWSWPEAPRHQPGPSLPDHRRPGGELQPHRAHRQHGAERPRAAPELPLLVRHRPPRAPGPRPHGPVVGEWIERPFARLGSTRYANSGGGLRPRSQPGPCLRAVRRPGAGAISAAEANHRMTPRRSSSPSSMPSGAALPLLSSPCSRNGRSAGGRNCAPPAGRPPGGRSGPGGHHAGHRLRPGSIRCRRAVPGYTSALEDHIESNGSIAKQLRRSTARSRTSSPRRQPRRPRWPPSPSWARRRTSPAS